MTRPEDLIRDIDFIDIYCTEEAAAAQPARYTAAIDRFLSLYPGADIGSIQIYSAPGRTEIGGNHTDHQHGEVLAASINRDAIAVTAPSGDDVIKVHAEGFDPVTLTTSDLEVKEDEKGTTAALVRGVIAGLAGKGYKIGGLNAYITSDVLIGAGLSSSAAFETLIGTVVSGMFNDMNITPEEIAKMGQYAENVFFDKPCGLMDQMASSVGSLVHIDFNDTASPIVEKVDYDLTENGYCLCITDTKGSHADLTSDYASIPAEMKKVAALLGHEVLRPVSASDILGNIDLLRREAGDRAVLRALHFVGETRRAGQEAEALKRGDTAGFLKLVRLSGDSSFKFLQNVSPTGSVKDQQMAIGLAVSEQILGEDEPARVHGGGFAGTIQAFVRSENADAYKRTMDKTFGEGACEILNIRKYGGMRIL